MPGGSSYLDRRNRIGAGCPVGAAECDMFVAVYRRDGRRHFRAAMLGVMVEVGAIVALFEDRTKVRRSRQPWRRRARALAWRLSMLPALDRAAARRRNLSQVTWGDRALGPVFVLMPASRAWRGDAVLGWSA
jgi:hypothetical protein